MTMKDTTLSSAISRRSALTGMGAAAALPLLMGAARGGAPSGVGPDTVYELRIYHCNAGKLPALLERFKKHEVKIFERLGMHPVAFWTSTEAPDAGNVLTYMLRHPAMRPWWRHGRRSAPTRSGWWSKPSRRRMARWWASTTSRLSS